MATEFYIVILSTLLTIALFVYIVRYQSIKDSKHEPESYIPNWVLIGLVLSYFLLTDACVWMLLMVVVFFAGKIVATVVAALILLSIVVYLWRNQLPQKLQEN